MAINIKKFRDEYKMYKSILARIKRGAVSSDEVNEYFLDCCGFIDDYKQEISDIIRQYESSIYMIYNVNRTISRVQFDKYYARFINADKEQKKFYERVNGMSYNEILNMLNNIKKDLMAEESKNEEDANKAIKALKKMVRDMKMFQERKQELIELGIAEDTGGSNCISIKPVKFVEYLQYLEAHNNIKI